MKACLLGCVAPCPDTLFEAVLCRSSLAGQNPKRAIHLGDFEQALSLILHGVDGDPSGASSHLPLERWRGFSRVKVTAAPPLRDRRRDRRGSSSQLTPAACTDWF